MKISLKWIKDYVDIPDNLNDFCDMLDLTGTGVEAIEHKGSEFDNIVTGQIVEKTAHPDSDHMFVTMVDVGQAEPLQIVCGAQNFKCGDHVVVALIGAVLQGKFKIKKSKLRGVFSFGMNCSKEELGLCDHSDGIMILPEGAPVGVPIAEYLGLSDTIIDLEITPNRPDCMSVVGLAREISAIYNTKFNNPLKKMASKIIDCPKTDQRLPKISIVDDKRCPRYTLRLINNVKIGPSPAWLEQRIVAMGGRSVNNVVDVTNYILYLFGQPLHTFDYDKIDGDQIIVRPACDGERFTTLDDKERILNSDMTVISSSSKAIALAGVMGGKNSEVDNNTCNILLETATFSPAHTSRTSRKLGLISESSMRYERRVDDMDIADISSAAAALIALVSGGSVSESFADMWPIKTQSKKLIFRIDRFNKMMGTDISKKFVHQTLSNLGCDVVGKFVSPPSYRPDLEREIDLYEEVLRIYGMDKVKASFPASPHRIGATSPRQKTLNLLNNTMTASGVNETISYSFTSKNYNKLFKLEKSIELLNPINVEQHVMRQSIVPGLLESVSYNINHGTENIALYETGIVFFSTDNGRPKEKERLACVLCGTKNAHSWHECTINYDFFDAKGIVENITQKLSIPRIRYIENDLDYLQPGRRCAVLSGGSYIGYIGQIHPNVLSNFEIDKDVVCFELDLDLLIKLSKSISVVKEISQYPGINVDIALTVDKDVPHEKIVKFIKSTGGKLLNKVELFDVYTNKNLDSKSKKSLAYSLEYKSFDKTLKQKEVEKIHNKMLKKLCSSVGAEIRS